MKQALIKKTGEIFDVISEYSLMKMSFSFTFDFPDNEDFEKKVNENLIHDGLDQVKISTGRDKEDFYELSNNITYSFDEIVIGLDDIRNWKLENNLNI